MLLPCCSITHLFSVNFMKVYITLFIYWYILTGIDELCAKRDDLQKQIKDEDEEKNKIQNDIQILTEKLAKINESLAKKIATRNDYDKTISETEAAYVKVTFSICSHTPLLFEQAS